MANFRNPWRPLLHGALFLALLVSSLPGQDDRDAVLPFRGLGGPGGRANGLGQAFTGVADDFTALYYNPAGLGNLTHGEINLGFSHQIVATGVTGPSVDDDASLSITRLANAGFVMPIPTTQITFAFGYNLVRSFERVREIHYRADLIENNESYEVEGKLGAFSLGLGYQLSPQVALGGALDFLIGGNDYTEQGIFKEQGYEDEAYYLQIEPDYSAIGLSLGLLVAPIKPLRLGLLLRTPQTVHVDEKYTDETLDGSISRDYTTKGPYSLRLGTALVLGPALISGDLSWFDYSQIRFESDLVDTNSNNIDIGINHAIRQNYRNMVGLALGSEVLLPVANVKLRGGYRYEPSYLKSDDTPQGKTSFLVGLSATPAPQIKLDAAYSYTVWKRDTAFYPSPYEETVHTITEHNSAGNFIINLIFRF